MKITIPADSPDGLYVFMVRDGLTSAVEMTTSAVGELKGYLPRLVDYMEESILRKAGVTLEIHDLVSGEPIPEDPFYVKAEVSA